MNVIRTIYLAALIIFRGMALSIVAVELYDKVKKKK